MKKEISAGVLVYTAELLDGLPTRVYLLLAYPSGYWDLAKGKLEEGETSKDAAMRELKEETGLEVRFDEGFMQELFYTYKAPKGVLVDKKVTFYLGESSTKQVRLSYEHKDYCWLPYDEAHKKLSFLNARNMLYDAEMFLRKL